MIRAFRTCAICLAVVIAGASPPAALAQNAYPAKPIRIVVPFGPGGSGDVIARILAIPLQQALGQGIIVENRGGAGSNIGTVAVARAEPDGYTLLLTTSAFVANPGLYRSIAYDPFRDFAPVADLAISPNVLVANPRSGIHSIAELIAMARAHPDQLNYSSGGIGTTANLAVEMLKVRAGISLTHISYRGAAPPPRRCWPASCRWPRCRCRTCTSSPGPGPCGRSPSRVRRAGATLRRFRP